MSAETIAELCPTLAELIQTQRAVGKTGRVYEGLAALSTTNNLRFIQALMRELRPERTLEIGLSFGGSALAFCASHRALGRTADAQHIAIDPFQTAHWDSCGLMAIERAGLSGYLDFRESTSALELPSLLASGREKFGLIYVDGSHLFEDVFIDAYFGARLLSQNGVIAFDDSTDPHVGKVLRFIRRNSKLEELDLGSYTKRNTRRLIARLLGRVQLTAFRRTGEVERNWNSPFRSF